MGGLLGTDRTANRAGQGVYTDSLISSRDFRHLIMAEISGSLACAQHRGLVYSSESLRGLSGGTARCVCNLLYDLFAWDAFPEGQQCSGGLW